MKGVDLLPEALGTLEGLALAVKDLHGTHPGGVGAKHPGEGAVDFLDYVPYHHGADLRFADWRHYARTRELRLRRDVRAEQHPITILLDRSGSMLLGAPEKWLLARRLAAAIAWLAVALGHPVGLIAFADGDAQEWPARVGWPWLQTLVASLGQLAAGGPTRLSASFTGMLGGARGRCFLISDLLDPSGAVGALGLLRAPGLRVDVVELVDSKEGILPIGETLDALDPEGPLRRTFTVTPEVAEGFAARLATHREQIRNHCRQIGLSHVRVEHDEDCVSALRRILEVDFD